MVGEKTFKGTSMHFTEKGILVTCKNPAPLNARGEVRLGFPGVDNAFELTGEVVWTNLHGAGDSFSPKGMGIKFINTEKETESLLAEIAAQYDSHGSIYSCYFG